MAEVNERHRCSAREVCTLLDSNVSVQNGVRGEKVHGSEPDQLSKCPGKLQIPPLPPRRRGITKGEVERKSTRG